MRRTRSRRRTSCQIRAEICARLSLSPAPPRAPTLYGPAPAAASLRSWPCLASILLSQPSPSPSATSSKASHCPRAQWPARHCPAGRHRPRPASDGRHLRTERSERTRTAIDALHSSEGKEQSTIRTHIAALRVLVANTTLPC
ncbi:hypothetical protein BD309DRAFT_292800 [Dichomitus squalens]|nr:hypothetical protein BD309DRAFT_292800 [Dichomitus squalens]